MRRVTLPRRGTSLSATGNGVAVRGTWLGIAVAALFIVVAGAALQARSQPAAGAVTSATLDGLTATPHQAGWVSMASHVLNGNGMYQMPAQMMPGAPAGDEMRLGVPLTLVNTGEAVGQFNLADEFMLTGGRNDAPRALHSDTFGQLSRLTPGNAVDGVLYFDTIVPGEGDPPLQLLWTRDGQTITLDLQLGAGTPDGHGGGHG